MQERNCIQERLVTEPCIRGPGLISDQKSSNGSICRREMEMTTESPLVYRSNVKKSDYIYDGRTQDQFKKSVLHLNDLDVVWDKHKSA